jgi:hypothetical protein
LLTLNPDSTLSSTAHILLTGVWGLAHTSRAWKSNSAACGIHSGPPTGDQAAALAVPEGLAAAVDGPALLYVDGLKSGQYRPDPLQQVTVAKLQVCCQG